MSKRDCSSVPIPFSLIPTNILVLWRIVSFFPMQGYPISLYMPLKQLIINFLCRQPIFLVLKHYINILVWHLFQIFNHLTPVRFCSLFPSSNFLFSLSLLSYMCSSFSFSNYFETCSIILLLVFSICYVFICWIIQS